MAGQSPKEILREIGQASDCPKVKEAAANALATLDSAEKLAGARGPGVAVGGSPEVVASLLELLTLVGPVLIEFLRKRLIPKGGGALPPG